VQNVRSWLRAENVSCRVYPRASCRPSLHGRRYCVSIQAIPRRPARRRYGSVATAVAASAGAGSAVAATSSAVFHDGWPLWTLLAACGAFAQLAENRTRWGAALSAPLLSMLCAVALAAAGIIPTDCTAYDTVWRYLMPLAAACYLLETD
ncbi:hypothetical protein Agub_g4584, partial [Astrephomene gubernaculifera]